MKKCEMSDPPNKSNILGVDLRYPGYGLHLWVLQTKDLQKRGLYMILLQLSFTVNIRIPFHMRLEWYYSWDSSPASLAVATQITHVYIYDWDN